MNQIRQFVRRFSLLTAALVLFGGWVVADVTILSPRAHAAMVTSRSLTLSSSAIGSVSTATPGDGGNGAKAKHTIQFNTASDTATIGSIALIYCDNPIPQTSCTSSTAATGDESNLTAATVSGLVNFSLDTTTANPTITGYGTCNGGGTTRSNCVLLKASGANTNVASGTTVTVEYGGNASDYVVNPTNKTTFYVRIIAFSDTGYTTVVDNGSVASATTQQIDITAKVQETLNFSVGAPDGVVDPFPAPGTTCTPFSDDGALALGDTNGVLNFNTAYDAHSYFRVSTNANGGTIIYYSGDTLSNTTGSGSITSIGTTSTASVPGTEQFGLAIDTGDSNSSLSQISAATTYADGDGLLTDNTTKFAHDTGSVTTPVEIASASAPVVCDTGSVRYLGNISTTTEPGIYTTKLTYIAVPTY